jgi:hypothetical protein
MTQFKLSEKNQLDIIFALGMCIDFISMAQPNMLPVGLDKDRLLVNLMDTAEYLGEQMSKELMDKVVDGTLTFSTDLEG